MMHSHNYSLALGLFQVGKLEEADALAKTVLVLNPSHVNALHLRGVIAGLKAKHAEAEGLLREAASLTNGNHFILFNLAKSLMEQGKHQESLEWHKKALDIDSTNDEAWLNFGMSLSELGDLEGALAAFDRALALNDRFAEAYSNKANCIAKMGLLNEAAELHSLAVSYGPTLAEAWNNQGAVLNDLQHHENALESYDRALQIRSDYAEAWDNRGVALNALGRSEDALTSYARALELEPGCAETWNNRGNALRDLRDYSGAFASYHRAISLKQGYSQALYNLGLLQLSLKEFSSGFENYAFRWETKTFATKKIETSLPSCTPNSIAERILLWAEQGLGDEIFYAGMLNEALKKFPKITLMADRRLHQIFARSFPGVELLDRGIPYQSLFDISFDCQAPIGDLGYILNLGAQSIDVPRASFLTADLTRMGSLNVPSRGGKIRCGLSWISRSHRFGRDKSIELMQFRSLFNNPRYEFVSLQYGDVTSDIQSVEDILGVRIHQIPGLDAFNDINGLLSLIGTCDVVISASNVTAHLAGALGKKGCVLVPFSKGKIWYWHPDDVQSFWYPSLRIFHQASRHDWTVTLSEVTEWLEHTL